MMKEELITVKSSGRSLYGMLHLPEGNGKFPGVIFLHGFTGTSIEPHRIFVKLARKIASKGMAAIRFDFSGAGQSQGESENVDFYNWIEDAENINSFFTEREEIDGESISFIGMSMGCAVLMFLHAKGLIKPVKNVFLCPGAALPQLVPGIMQKGREAGDFIDIWGNKISKKSMETAAKIDILGMEYKKLPPAIIFHCKDDDIVPFEAGMLLKETLEKNGVNPETVIFNSGGHGFNDIMVEKELMEKAVNFLTGQGA